MISWYDEHLTRVADRNKKLYQSSIVRFEKHMFNLGWGFTSIEKMKKYLKRKD